MKMSAVRFLLPCFILILFIPLQGFAQQPSFPNTFGWTWLVTPSVPEKGLHAFGPVSTTLVESKDSNLVLVASYGDRVARIIHSLVAVAFDSVGQRYQFNSQGSTYSEAVTLRSYKLPASRLPASRVTHIGIELLTEENLRTVLAPAAFEKLRAAGQEALPFPEIGKPYQFQLTAIDGTTITSNTLTGKVVLLDFWASWCAPCMAKMPALKALYDKFRDRGFEIIGLNHDFSLETAKKFTQKENLPWPIVLAPTADQYRELWQEATGVSALPSLFLIDKHGLIRAEVSIADLPHELEKLVSE